MLSKQQIVQLSQEEFISRIILVGALAPDSVANYVLKVHGEEKCDHYITSMGEGDLTSTVLIEDEQLIQRDGTVGGHLDLSQHQYKPMMVDRPHLHWTMCSLVHSNSGGDWELAKVAYFEPVKNIKHVLGFAPYDTTTMGAHRLSKESILLVPAYAQAAIQKRLTDYQGKVVAYDPKLTLRQAVVNTLKIYYPYAFDFVNRKGTSVNTIAVSDGSKTFDRELCIAQDYDTVSGYFRAYDIKASDGVVPFLRGKSSPQLQVYQDYCEGKILGTHHGSVTDIEKCDQFKLLGQVSSKPEGHWVEHETKFVGKKWKHDPKSLLCVVSYKKHMELVALDRATGSYIFAQYLVKKAIIADLTSYHYHHKGQKQLSHEAAKQMVEGNFESIFSKLKDLSERGDKEAIIAYTQTIRISYHKVIDPELAKANTVPQIEEAKEDARVNKSSSSWCSFWTVGAAVVAVGVVAVVGKAIYDGHSNNTP